MPVVIGAQGLNLSVPPVPVTLAGLQSYLIPSGQYVAQLGAYTTIEWYDPVLGFWRNWAATPGRQHTLDSDGTNFRLINRTGGPMGAVMTNLGTGYTSAPSVVSSTGGSLWTALLGGALNTTVTVATAGSYNYVPTLIFPPAPAGGITPTATVQLTSGAISGVTIVNRGAGLIAAPVGSIAVAPGSSALQTQANIVLGQQQNKVVIVPDPRETGTGGGALTFNATLAGAGSVTGVICTDPGTTVQTALPTLTFSGGGGANAAATVLMNWSVTGYTVGTAGAGYGNAQPFKVIANNMLGTAAPAAGDTNPLHNLGLAFPRNCSLAGTSTAGGATQTGAVIEDGGWGIQRIPELIVLTGQLITTAAALTATVGATTDTTMLQQVQV